MKKPTPMVLQYMEIKKQYNDCVLLFRLGDFYEMFYEDAIKASKILQIALTRRNKTDPDQVMCGIPFHASESYIAKLSKAGEKVAICEQLSKPDGKGIVKRDVVRVVTPGTTFDENILDQKSNNFVANIVKDKDVFALSYCDITTGDFYVSDFLNFKDLKDEFLRISPKELILSTEDYNDDFYKNNLLKNVNCYVYKYDFFDNAEEFLKKEFSVHSLSVFGLEDKNALKTSSARLYSYLKETQKTSLKHIHKISRLLDKNFLSMNDNTIKNLEIFYSPNNNKENTLFSILDNCVGSMGSRLLKKSLLYPFCDKNKIDYRLNLVEKIFLDSELSREIEKNLSCISDIERLLAKIGVGNANARDVLALKNSISVFPFLNKLEIDKDRLKLDELNELYQFLDSAISDDVPNGIREGGFIKKGFNIELDEIREILFEGKKYILNMQEREIQRTGINNLKIKYNKVFGYYIEISKGNLKNVPDDYMRKQTLVNAERFITPELKEYEEKVLKASERVNELEFELFHKVRMEILEKLKELQINAKKIAEIDLLLCFSINARKYNYVRPEISETFSTYIKNGRHPVVENIIGFNNFVANDFIIDEKKGFLLITGPNMGGKSTYLRQNALIVLMAQIGSFVPASEAKIGVVDKIFSRVGANDNLSKGESTFMVEMQETSYILNNASEKSLIILDEIGRGTSTYDGLSIAWSVSEYICENIKAKTLFATHYHELTDFSSSNDFAENLSVKVLEKDDKSIVFLYKIIQGAINKSYGIEVAKLSGLSRKIIDRSYEILKELEKKKIQKNKNSELDKNQLSMFEEEREKSLRLKKELEKIDVNQLTPIEAISKLNDLISNSKK